jgi:hypothetical protein
MKTFDLNETKYIFSSNLQKNLKKIEKIFGKIFFIKFNDIKIKVKLKIVKHKFMKLKYYTLTYDIKNREFIYYPLEITFIDTVEGKCILNNNCMINNIHKTDKISGSQLIQLAINLCKCLKVKKSYLFDEASIECNEYSYDLSYIKLLQNNLTFYMKYGFEIDINYPKFNLMFNNKKKKYIFLYNLIKSCKKVKNKDIIKLYKDLLKIIINIIVNQDYNNLKIYNKYILDNDKTLNKISIYDLFINVKNVLDLLCNNKEKYLYETMIKLFNDKNLCSKYYIIENNFIYDLMYEVIYKNKKINFGILYNFKLLHYLRQMTYYSYTYY